MPRIITAIVDRLAMDITTGSVTTVPHAAVAIRFFGDVLTHPESSLGKHPEDYELVQLAVLNDDLTVTPAKEILLTGAQWLAAQARQQ